MGAVDTWGAEIRPPPFSEAPAPRQKARTTRGRKYAPKETIHGLFLLQEWNIRIQGLFGSLVFGFLWAMSRAFCHITVVDAPIRSSSTSFVCKDEKKPSTTGGGWAMSS